MYQILRDAFAIIFIVTAVISDYKEYKIKNKSVLIFLTIGLMLGGVTGGFNGLLDSLCGLLVPLVLFPLFSLKMLGAGDIKALCAIGSIVGLKMSIYTLLFSLIAGGIIALGFMIFRRNALVRAKQFGAYMKQCFYARKLLPYDHFTDQKSGFRFSFGILGGLAASTILLQVFGF